MKNIIKSIFLFAITISIFSCDNDNDSGNFLNEESGWVQFMESSPTNITVTQVTDQAISLDVNVQVPSTSRDLSISYDLVPVSGLNPNTTFSNSGVIVAPAGSTSWSGSDNNTGIEYAYLAAINFDLTELPLLTENMVFDVVLTGTDAQSVTAGIGTEKPISKRITICNKFISSTTFTGDAFTLDLGIGAGGIVNPYAVTLVPVSGSCGTWSTTTSWGPEFVSFLCGGCVPVGSFPNASTIVINDDNSITVTGENGDGTGLYDPATGTITLNIAQTLFNSPFTVDVVLTP